MKMTEWIYKEKLWMCTIFKVVKLFINFKQFLKQTVVKKLKRYIF